MKKQLPARASVQQLKKQAKDLLTQLREGSQEARDRIRAFLPDAAGRLADAQLVVAREYGFGSGTKLRHRVEAIDLTDPVTAFTEAAAVPLGTAGHDAGGLEGAQAVLAAHPSVASHDIFVAALLGDDAAVARFVERDPAAATAPGGLFDWDPLTYLCFSRYLRDDRSRGDAFVRAARVLLDHGASADTGFYAQDHEPEPAFESVIYAAAGIARHPELTRLLLAHGADPNDDETPYHAPETLENAALMALVESGRVGRKGLTTMLARKHDWHDYAGIAWLLDHGADPNEMSAWGRRALHQALERDNPLRFFELLLDRGADPGLGNAKGKNAIATAARAGRADVLDLFERRGFPAASLDGGDALLAACAHGDRQAAERAVALDSGMVRAIEAEQPGTLAAFAGAADVQSVALLLDLGFDPARTTCRAGAHRDTALHAAIWRGRHDTAKLLVARGAPLEAKNGDGETPLAYAARAALMPWVSNPSTETAEALLAAGADPSSVKLPTGWDAFDALLTRR
jgi:ankyrin repeat protein